jgi:hypothetical protein
MRPAALAAMIVAALSASGSRGSATASCTPVPHQFGSTLIPDRAKAQVAVGAIVYVALVEPEKYTSSSYPRGFPWRPPASSDTHVFAPVKLCPDSGATTLPRRVFAFRARRHGQAKLVARLSRGWKSPRHRPHPYPHPYRSTVRVSGSG